MERRVEKPYRSAESSRRAAVNALAAKEAAGLHRGHLWMDPTLWAIFDKAAKYNGKRERGEWLAEIIAKHPELFAVPDLFDGKTEGMPQKKRASAGKR